MGKLFDQMTALAVAIRRKSGATGKLSISEMTAAVNLINVSSGMNTSDGTADESCILEPYTAYAQNRKIHGSMPDHGSLQKGLTPAESGVQSTSAGYFSEVNIWVDATEAITFTPSNEQQTYDGNKEGKFLKIVTVEPIPSGSITIDGDKVSVSAGYLQEQTLDIQAGSVTVDGPDFIVSAGYLSSGKHTVQPGRVFIDNLKSKVVVNEGYIYPHELDLPGGFQLVKVTNYHPAREEFSDVGSVVVSAGQVQGELDSADFSEIDGIYEVTDETQYRKGLARVFKQQGGKYYLCGYEPENDWGESPHWYIAEKIGSYGYSAKAVYYNKEIPSGIKTWYSEQIGNFQISTTPTIVAISGVTDTTSAVAVTGFDAESTDWITGENVNVSDYSIYPQVGSVYFLQGEKLIGQHIDRELTIPQDGLVRRWKAVGKHFVDTVWGTEMFPDGEISFDELGYAGNNAAPLSKDNSCMYTVNSYSFGLEVTLSAFVKPYYGTGMIFGFGNRDRDQANLALYTTGVTIGSITYLDTNISYGRWNSVVMTLQRTGTDSSSTGVVKVYTNGKLIKEFNSNATQDDFIQSSFVGILNQRAVTYASDNLVSMVDEACVWNRILTDEEIAEMAKGVQTFNWDIPVPEYVQKQPVFHAPLTDTSRYCPTGQAITLNWGEIHPDDPDYSVYFRDGAWYNFMTKDDGSFHYCPLYCNGNHNGFYSGSFTVFVEFCFVDYIDPDYWYSRAKEFKVINSLKVYKVANSSDIMLQYAGVAGSAKIEKGVWVTLAACCDKGTVTLYTDCFQNGQGVIIDTAPADGVVQTGSDLKMGIKNVRFYNRALSFEEIQKLHGRGIEW